MGENMKELNENLAELITASSTLVLQFGSNDCGPCHAIKYKLEKWLEGRPEVASRYVDITTHTEECAQMGIFSAPTVIVYMDGQVVAKESGYFSLNKMLNRVERYLKMRE